MFGNCNTPSPSPIHILNTLILQSSSHNIYMHHHDNNNNLEMPTYLPDLIYKNIVAGLIKNTPSLFPSCRDTNTIPN